MTTVEVRSRETYTPGELSNDTTLATEPAQTLGSDMNDEKEEPIASLQEPSELECVLKQELGNISQVSLIKTVRLPANFTAVVPVQVLNEKGTVMLYPSDSLDTSLNIVESLIEVNQDGPYVVVVANTGKSTYQLQKGMDLGQVVEVELVIAKDEDLPVVCEGSVEEAVKPLLDQVNLFGISLQSKKTVERIKWRQQQMSKMLRESNKLLSEEHLPLEDLLVEYHDIFSLEEDERGETDLIEFDIDTSDEAPN